jgi:hypothetical protein
MPVMKSFNFGAFVSAALLLSMGICGAHDSEGNRPGSFVSADGRVLELSLAGKTISVPGRDTKSLKDCGDEFQVCLTDTYGFSFSFFKSCSDAERKDGYNRLRFHPRVVSMLHEHLWLVFEDAPRFMFDYSLTRGLVGIYYDQKHHLNFLSLSRSNRIELQKLTEHKFVLRDVRDVAACAQ